MRIADLRPTVEHAHVRLFRSGRKGGYLSKAAIAESSVIFAMFGRILMRVSVLHIYNLKTFTI